MTRNVPVWEDAPWRGFPPLREEIEADLCVVGLGGSGMAAVLRGISLGARVVGLDAGRVAGGASGRNGGFLLAGTALFHHAAVERYGRRRAVALHAATLEEIDRMAGETPGAIRRTGSLRIAADRGERVDCRRQLDALSADGLPGEPYAGAEGEGILLPRDATFHPVRRQRLLAERATAAGARLYEASRAEAIAGRGVRTRAGRVRCGAVVVAVDGGLPELIPELRGRVRTARLQMLATSRTGEVQLPRPVYSRYGLDYWHQLPDGRLAVGGLRDVGGTGEWTTDPRPGWRVQSALERLLRERIGVSAPVTHRWAASVGYTESGLPVLEEVRPGVFAVGGYCGTGNVIGSLCGRAAAERALGTVPWLEHLLSG
jgi:gamma-glutamylputrescine oxidase